MRITGQSALLFIRTMNVAVVCTGVDALSTSHKRWIRCFLNHHPNLPVRKPETMSLASAKGFREGKVNTFNIRLPEQQKIYFGPKCNIKPL
jgi:hypothetical protein